MINPNECYKSIQTSTEKECQHGRVLRINIDEYLESIWTSIAKIGSQH